MLDHHLQRSIVYHLAFVEKARFSELKPDDVESKLFTYHLKKVVSSGYIQKSEDGLYCLTPEGRRLSTGARVKEKQLIVERAHSVLFLVIRRKSDGAWLFYTRNTHPMRGFSGLMHCNPSVELSAEKVAEQECRTKTGLSGTFTALGGGYIKVFDGKRLESFTHFTLLYCDDIQGELDPNDPQAEYFWAPNPSTVDKKLFPATHQLLELYEARKPFFIDTAFQM